jgi:hypothetical protein
LPTPIKIPSLQDFLLGALRSTAVMALFCYTLINLSLGIAFSINGTTFQDSVLAQNPIALKLLTNTRKPWDVALMGSSLMIVPFSLMDGLYGYSPTPTAFAKELAQASLRCSQVANVSLEAAMISDQYLLIKKYLNGPLKPRVVVLGIAPPDFSDDRWKSVSNTYTFKSLVNVEEVALYPLYLDNLEQYTRFFVNQLIYLYNLRTVVARATNQGLEMWLDKILPPQPTPMVENTQVGRPKFGQNRNNDANRLQRIERSIKEYQSVYSTFSRSQSYTRQLQFLARILDLCQKKSIPLALVNLPLTSLNRSLLPPGFYRQYQTGISELAQRYDIVFLDLSSARNFKDDEDFWDTAHLNQSGGRKLTRLLIPILVKLIPREKQQLPERTGTK